VCRDPALGSCGERGDGASGDQPAIDAVGADARALGEIPGVTGRLGRASPYPRVAGAPQRAIDVRGARVGGGEPPALFAGPCAVEDRAQLMACAAAVAAAGGRFLRGGAFKPRTSPYEFQGLGEEGLRLLREAGDRFDLRVVTEVMEPAAVPLVAEHADVLQIGSRNMQSFALLREVGRHRRPVLLKRGMSATLEEWLLAAEYVMEAGNAEVILCERGLRSFDSAARNLLDLAAVPLIRARTALPIIVDPSHGVGVRDAIPAMALAAIAAGADGVMLEAHPDPGRAKSDGFQALQLEDLAPLAARMRGLAELLRA
jgi:3-deoxy-7-phosphoheptulonate synthase